MKVCKKTKIKIGDIVRIMGNSKEFHWLEIGSKGRVIGKISNRYIVEDMDEDAELSVTQAISKIDLKLL